MTKQSVQIVTDVHCNWEGLNPTYRLYVNNELFTERTWDWDGMYLEETVALEAEPGDYYFRWELVPPHLAHLDITNMRVGYGNIVRINHETV